MNSVFKTAALGLFLVFSASACKDEKPKPGVMVTGDQKPAASAAPSAATSAVTTPPASKDEPYTAAEMAADMVDCAEKWWSVPSAVGIRCTHWEKMWSEGNPEVAAKKYKEGCDRNEPLSCFMQIGAVYHPKSPFLAKNQPIGAEEVIRLLIKACELGQADACMALSKYDTCAPAEGEQDEPWLGNVHPGCPTRIREYLKKKNRPDLAPIYATACKSGNARACTFHAKKLAGTRFSTPESEEANHRACDLGDVDGCKESRRIASFDGRQGEVKTYYEKELAILERNCWRMKECTTVTGLYRDGPYLSPNDQQAGKFPVPPNLVKARQLYEWYCKDNEEKHYGTECLKLADMQAAGEGGPEDFAAAIRRYEPVCGRPITSDSDPEEIVPIAKACHGLARLYIAGKGLAKDEAKAQTLLKNVCIDRAKPQPEVKAACDELAKLSQPGAK